MAKWGTRQKTAFYMHTEFFIGEERCDIQLTFIERDWQYQKGMFFNAEEIAYLWTDRLVLEHRFRMTFDEARQMTPASLKKMIFEKIETEFELEEDRELAHTLVADYWDWFVENEYPSVQQIKERTFACEVMNAIDRAGWAKLLAPNPVTGRDDEPITLIIPALNDQYGWSPAQIADWLDKLHDDGILDLSLGTQPEEIPQVVKQERTGRSDK